MGLETHDKKNRLLWLGINEGEVIMLGRGKMGQLDSFTYLDVSKYGGCGEDKKKY